MKILVSYSGGKDSQAFLINAIEEYGADKVTAVFCDTGWEHPDTDTHIRRTTEALSVNLITLKSKFDFVIEILRLMHDKPIVERLINAEQTLKQNTSRRSTFFRVDYIPAWACSDRKSPTIQDIFRYVSDKNATLDLFEPEGGYSCINVFHGLCE